MGRIKIKAIYLSIVLLLATNIIFLFLLLNGKNTKSNVEVFTLNGEGIYWTVENHKVIRTKSTIWRGSAGLHFLGNEEDIIDSNYFSYQFVEVKGDSETETVLAGSSNSSTNEGVNILGNIDKLGSISGPLSPREKQMTKDDFERSYMIVAWTDSKGEEKSERIELNIADHIELK